MGTKKDSTIYDVAIYCRLSKEDLKEDGDRDESASIGTQKAILTDYVRQRGWHLVQTYVDDGYSGTNFQRPGFQSMIRDIEAKRINCVITKDDCVILELNSESPENTGLCDVSSVF